MQKSGWTYYSSFLWCVHIIDAPLFLFAKLIWRGLAASGLVWSCLVWKKGYLWVTIFLCTRPFLACWRKADSLAILDQACPLGRGVRSDAQLSCTETRFRKCSQSGKNGSKHPMLSISMAYNVISCKKNRKKHSKNQNRWFYNVNSAPELRSDQKPPKKGLLNFLYMYGIF